MMFGRAGKIKFDKQLKQAWHVTATSQRTGSCFPFLSSESSNRSTTFDEENDNNNKGIEIEPFFLVKESITEEVQTSCKNCHRTGVSVTVATKKDMHYRCQ
jgi:hypothetical protein